MGSSLSNLKYLRFALMGFQKLLGFPLGIVHVDFYQQAKVKIHCMAFNLHIHRTFNLDVQRNFGLPRIMSPIM
jgi:hypothetical protein